MNILNGPGSAQAGSATRKSFRIRESISLLYRLDAANLFNRVHPIRSLSGGARNLQMALRLLNRARQQAASFLTIQPGWRRHHSHASLPSVSWGHIHRQAFVHAAHHAA